MPTKTPRLNSLYRSSILGEAGNKLEQEVSVSSDRAAALIMAAEVDYTLELSLKHRIVNELDNGQINELFGETGPLMAFGAKIRIGYAYGLFGPITAKDLKLISAVRNAFAHSALPISFSTSLITENCNRLAIMALMKDQAWPDVSIEQFRALSPRDQYLCTCRAIIAKLSRNNVAFLTLLDAFNTATPVGTEASPIRPNFGSPLSTLP